MDGEQGGGGAAIEQVGGGEQQQQASWRDSLPADMRGAPEIANYADLNAAVQGLIESKKAATARQPDFKSEEGFNAFLEANAPADAAAYEILVAEGHPTALADEFRAFAHERKYPPQFVKEVAEFNNAAMQRMIAAEEKASEEEVGAFKTKIGGAKFEAGLQSVRSMLENFPTKISAEGLAKLDKTMGSSELLGFLFDMAARVGDPAPIENPGGAANTGALSPEQAKARWDVVQKDATWRAQAKIEGTPERREYERLQTLITQARHQKPK